MYPFTNTIGQMKVSQAMRLLNFIAADWQLKMGCIPEEEKMISFKRSDVTATRILKNSARNN